MTGQSNSPQLQKQHATTSSYLRFIGGGGSSGNTNNIDSWSLGSDNRYNTKGGIGNNNDNNNNNNDNNDNNDDNDNHNNIHLKLNTPNATSTSDATTTTIPKSTTTIGGLSSLFLPSNIGVLLLLVRLTLGATVALYILNQKHMLPYPISKVVSRVLFWPTLPITVSKRFGKWYTPIDDTLIMGGAPFGFAKIPELLYEQYDVRGVINLCEEYRGPDRSYQQLGIQHLYLPTTDHYEPSLRDIYKSIKFIQQFQRRNERVYVHCRAGHGRSAAIAYAWLLTKNPSVNLQQLNHELCQQRNVRKTLYQQPNILQYHSMLLQQQRRRKNNGVFNDDNDTDDEFDFMDDDDNEGNGDDSKYSSLDNVDNDDDDDDDDSQLYSFKNIEDEL